ncbi:MAG TPA: hypothetical protein VNO69_11375 [Methyloceanibacter sp.]|jgi:flagellar protein FliO/FliZ|nr:hypothetical protein [Methyloceanibacter sp.]
MLDLNTLLLAVAGGLFVVALIALLVWAFKVFFGRSSSPGFLKARERRLAVIETATIDTHRKLVLLRRDDVEHLMVIGGPVDMVIESGIRPRLHFPPPHEDVIVATSEARPAPDFSKTGSV